MPIYCYETLDGSCSTCGGRFEILRPLSRPDLKECPLCKKPVQKIMTPIHTPKHNRPPGLSEIKNAGFKVYHKVDQGVYEQQ